jgi:hypothetical protein
VSQALSRDAPLDVIAVAPVAVLRVLLKTRAIPCWRAFPGVQRKRIGHRYDILLRFHTVQRCAEFRSAGA